MNAPDDAKAVATLRAKAAVAGIRVDRIETDDGRDAFVVTRWAHTKQCDTLDDLTGFLRLQAVDVGGANGYVAAGLVGDAPAAARALIQAVRFEIRGPDVTFALPHNGRENGRLLEALSHEHP